MPPRLGSLPTSAVCVVGFKQRKMILEIILIIVPVLLAGLGFILVLQQRWCLFLRHPLDGGRLFNGLPLLGPSKTWSGPVIMTVGTMLVGVFMFGQIRGFSGTDIFYVALSYGLVGLLYSIGELPNSFIKRRLGVPAGGVSPRFVSSAVFQVVDTFDSLVACGVGYYLLLGFSLRAIFLALGLGGVIHWGTDQLMKQLRLK